MISTEIKLFDSMSPILKNIASSVDAITKALGNTEKASENMIDTAAVRKASDSFNEAVSNIYSFDEALIGAKMSSESAGNSIDGLSNNIINNKNVMSDAIGTAKKLLGAYLSFQGIKKFVESADEFQNISTRLGMVSKSFDEAGLDSKVFMERTRRSATASRGEFMMTADVISKLGMQARNAFGSSDELIIFAEQLNKNFKIAGTDAEGIRSVMYNLTQALASGVLRGQDLNSVMSNAPIILEKVANYMGEDMSQIRKLAEEGRLSADVIVKAMLDSAERTNEAFESMPMTFADIMTRIKNEAQRALSGAFIKWNELLNSDNMKNTIDFIVQLISSFVETVADIIGLLIDLFGPIVATIGKFGDVINIAVTAFIAFKLAVWAVNTAMTVFNITCNANPIILIITAVLTLIMLLVKWIQSVGGVAIAWLKLKLTVINIFAVLYTTIGSFITLCASAILGVVSLVLHAVQSMVNAVIKGFNTVIAGANHIPGVNIGLIGEAKFADNYDTWANGIRDKMSDGLIAKSRSLSEKSKGIENEIKIKQDEIARKKEENKFDMSSLKVPEYKEELKGIGKDLGKTDGHAGSIDKKLDDGLEVNNEDLKAIRDVMFQRAIQNLSWDKIDVHVDNSFGDVHETADTDSIIKSIEDGLYEAVERVGVMV